MININSERLEFEETMKKNGAPDCHLRKDRKGKYLRKNIQSAFNGWVLKSSRYSVKSCDEQIEINICALK